MRQVAIFRNNLFRISEPFITHQAQRILSRLGFPGNANFAG